MEHLVTSHALCGFKFDSNFAIPFSVMFRSYIVGYDVLVILHRFWKSVFVNSVFSENAIIFKQSYDTDDLHCTRHMEKGKSEPNI
jgi:hypothetical protein